MSFELLIAVVIVLLTLLQAVWRNRVQNKDALKLAWYGAAGSLGVLAVFAFFRASDEPELVAVGEGLSGLALVFSVVMIQRALAGGSSKLL